VLAHGPPEPGVAECRVETDELVLATLRDVVRRRTTRLLLAGAPCHELQLMVGRLGSTLAHRASDRLNDDSSRQGYYAPGGVSDEGCSL
jgi:hypothetical protein